jgi:hypothetical protein
MKKLLIVSAILATGSLSGSAFAQHFTSASNSPTIVVGSPVIGVNVGVVNQIQVLSNSSTQNASVLQGNTGSIGIGGASGRQFVH